MIKILSQSKKQTEANFNKAKQGLESFLERTDIGFPNLPQRESLWSSSQKLGQELRAGFTDVVVIGIGGSSLGGRVVQEIFQKPNSKHRLHFCDNVDSAEFERMLSGLDDLNRTAWLAVSKSGSTIETLMAVDLAHNLYQGKGISFFPNLYMITENKKNPLKDLADQHSRPALEIPLDVGGRFSVLSPVGMVLAAYLGQNVQEFSSGAKKALAQKELIAQVSAFTLDSYDRGEWITLFWFYSSWMKNFGGWLQQLWAESLGKKLDRKGGPASRASTPVAAIGACDQHSILQQVMEGTRDKFVIFTRIKTAEADQFILRSSLFPSQKFLEGKSMGQLLGAEAIATAQSLSESGVSTLTLELNDLSAQSVGEFFMFWQMVVATLGECLDINAFDQPGVELGKRLARDIISRYEFT